MCNQAVGLVAAELERRGIATVVLQLLREVAERVRPPRALFVPFRHGYPLDTPNDSRMPAVRRNAAAATIHNAAPTSAPGRQSRQVCLTFGL